MNNIQKTVTGIVAAATILTSAGVSAKVNKPLNKKWYFTGNTINKIFGKFPNINDCLGNGTTQKLPKLTMEKQTHHSLNLKCWNL